MWSFLTLIKSVISDCLGWFRLRPQSYVVIATNTQHVNKQWCPCQASGISETEDCVICCTEISGIGLNHVSTDLVYYQSFVHDAGLVCVLQDVTNALLMWIDIRLQFRILLLLLLIHGTVSVQSRICISIQFTSVMTVHKCSILCLVKCHGL